jgi:hypothetical protein
MDLGTLDADGAPMEGTGPCSGSDKGDDPDGDGDGDGDPDSANCGLSAGLGDLYSGVGAAATGTTGYASLVKVLDESATPDLLSFSMVDGYGAFADGLVPGLYHIAGDDTAASCGLCVYISVDVQEDGSAANYLLADSGTLTLATIDPTPGTGQVAGTLSNVHMREVAFDEAGNLIDVADGCATDIDTWSFDVGVTGF